MKNIKRKMLAAREDLVDRVSEIARRKGTLYEFVNDVLQEAIRADSMGTTIKEALDEVGLIKMAKDSGFILVPERLWYEVVERLGARSSWIKNLWHETGAWYAKFYGSPERFAEFIRILFWDLVDFSISRVDGGFAVKCLCPKFNINLAELFSIFLEGAYEAFGLHVMKRDVSRGVIYMEFASAKG
ncbi:MAG: hypothetical protein N3F10_07695 [Candidatus Bathyarchaeota archaeon]|nr:hypothetical protein [Candidatus Bathyarchaeota archaeon]